MIKIQEIVFFKKVKINFFVFLFFVLYLLLGLTIFRDYGAFVTEINCRNRGILALEFISEGNLKLFMSESEISHGQIFELFLVVIEKLSGIANNFQKIIFLRHFVNFLLFYIGVVVFYFFCKKRFSNWKMGLLGSFFLVLSPVIFAHSFFNSKDIPFMVFFLISMVTLNNFLEKKTYLSIILHSLFSSLAIVLRIAGVLIVFLTFILLLAEFFKKRMTGKLAILQLLVYFFLTLFFTIIFWPSLWISPLYYFFEFLRISSHYKMGPKKVFYLGERVATDGLPWHYVIVFIVLTTPLLYTFFFISGVFKEILQIIKNKINFVFEYRIDFICLFCFFIPLILFLIFRPIIYNGWRHFFFVYPSFLLIGLVGFEFIFNVLKKHCTGLFCKFFSILLAIFIVFDLFSVLKFMIFSHPYQNVYFNRLAGKNLEEVQNLFNLDINGISYKKCLEYILKTDSSKKLLVFLPAFPSAGIERFSIVLSERDRKRLINAKNWKSAQYVIAPPRIFSKKSSRLFFKKVFSVKVEDAELNAVYKREK